MILVCENNGWASTTPFSSRWSTTGPWPVHSVERISERAAAYGVPGVTVDGNDVLAVYHVAQELIARARRGDGPSLLECMTYRLRGHYVGDPEKYRDKGELAQFLEKEPIVRMEAYLKEGGYANEAVFQAIRAQAETEVDEAVAFAEASPWPDPADSTTDVFVHSVPPYPWEEEIYGQ